MHELDDFDRKIIFVFRDRGYLKNADLAELVGLSTSACQQRVARLKKRGILNGFKACIDLSKFQPSIRVLTLLMLEKQSLAEFQEFNARIQNIPEIVRAYRVTGDFDYAIEIIARDFQEFRSILESLMSTIEIKQYQSRIMQEAIIEEKAIMAT